MRGSFAAFALMAMLAGMPAQAENWWTEDAVTMPQLVAQGYTVVGFSVVPVPNRIYSDVIAFRYVLQKVGTDGTVDVAMCSEKFGTNGMLISTSCHRLDKP